jgi:hypothetical protein
MAGERGIGSRILGTFFNHEEPEQKQEPAPAAKGQTPAELVAEIAAASAKPSAPAQPVAPASVAAAPTSASKPFVELPPTDFDKIFREAGMDVSDLDRVKKAEELLKSLPADTPPTVQKQIVEASLKAFGFDVQKIVAAAQNQRRALDTYVKVTDAATAKAVEDAETQIRTLTEKIASLHADSEKRTDAKVALASQAQERKAQVQRIIDFFAMPVSVVPPK